MIGAWIAIVIFGVRFVCVALAYRLVEGDLYWQRALGQTILRTHTIPATLDAQSFAAPHAAWVPQEALFGVAVALANTEARWDVLAAISAVCALAALALAAYRAVLRGAQPFYVALCTGFAAVALDGSFGVRAQVAGWPLLVLAVLAIERGGRAAWWAVPIATVWACVHASVLILPVTIAALAVGAALDDGGWSPRVRDRAVIAVASLAALCVNPVGPRLVAYAAGLQFGHLRQAIVEWTPPHFDSIAFSLGALQLLIIVVARGYGRRGTWSDAVLTMLFTLAMLSAFRHTELFALLVLAPAAAALTPREAPAGRQTETRSPIVARLVAFGVPLAAGAFITAGTLVALRLTPPPATTRLPVALIAVLARVPRPVHLFCGNFAWCSVAVGQPRIGVFLDGRADPYPQDVWDDASTIVLVQPGWRDRIAARGIDTIIEERGDPLDQALERTPGWRERAHDLNFRLWTRDVFPERGKPST